MSKDRSEQDVHGSYPAGGRVVSVVLKMMSGDVISLQVGEKSQVQDLKSEVFRLRGMPPDCQQILQGSNCLDDCCVVEELCQDAPPLNLSLVVSLERVAQALESDRGSIVATIRALDLLSHFAPADYSQEAFHRHLKHSHEDVRRAALRALLRTAPEDSAELLLQSAKDSSSEVRQDAMEALPAAAQRDGRALQIALDGCRDNDAPVRRAAVLAVRDLAKTGLLGANVAPCVEQLQTLLGDADAHVREAALEALHQLESKKVAEGCAAAAVERLLRSSSWSEWLWVLQASGLTHREQAEKFLKHLMNDSVAQPNKLQGVSPGAKIRALMIVREAFIESTPNDAETPDFSDRCVCYFAACLQDSSSDVRAAAVHALPDDGTSAAVQLLLTQSLSDKSPEVRQRSAEKLVAMDEIDLDTAHAILEQLQLCLHGSDTTMKVWAVSLLAGLPQNSRALELAASFHQDAVVEVRLAALRAICKLDKEGSVSSKVIKASFADPAAALRSAAWAVWQNSFVTTTDIDIDSFVSGLVNQQDSFEDFLREVRPTWTDKELREARRKLKQVGVESVAQLAHHLPSLNKRLSAAGLRCFSAETLRLLKQHLQMLRIYIIDHHNRTECATQH